MTKKRAHGDEEIEDLHVSEGSRGRDPYHDPTWDGIQDLLAPIDAERGLHPSVDPRGVLRVVEHGRDATAYARHLWHSMDHSYYRECLRFVHECLDTPARYLTANQAWFNAQHRQAFTSEHDIPFASPVFTDRVEGSSLGHVCLAGGKFKSDGARIFWTTDQFADGRITPVRLSFFRDNWNHYIRGFTRDLNGVGIPYLLDGKGR